MRGQDHTKGQGGRPTPGQVKAAKKAELVFFAETLQVSTAGTVEELRERLLHHLASEPEEAPKGEAAPKTLEEPPKEESKEPKKEGASVRFRKRGAKKEKKEEVKIVEEEKKRSKIRPELPEALRGALALRNRRTARKPAFIRHEGRRYPRLGYTWRRPKGLHNKQRIRLQYRPKRPSIGYGAPRLARELHPSGFQEVLVHHPGQLGGIDPKRQAARIAHDVGARKRLDIHKKADQLGIRILNRVGLE